MATDIVIKDKSKNEFCSIRHHNGEINIYLYNSIESPFNYIEALEKLRNHDENHYVNVRIDSNGGWLRTAMLFRDAIMNRRLVRTYIDCEAASAASVIALSANDIVVASSAYMLCHAVSSGTDGKMHEIAAYSQGFLPYCKTMLRNIYKGFLTADEIESLIKGEDFWFDADEIKARLDTRASFIESLKGK